MSIVLWFTGLSGSGKTTIAEALKKELESHGKTVEILDGDVVREKHPIKLGFSREDIRANNKLIAELAKQSSADVVLVPVISPYREDREMVKKIIEDIEKESPAGRITGKSFYELFVNTPLQECIKRDVKGLYQKALSGKINNFIGISDSNSYEKPENPNIEIRTDKSIQDNVKEIMIQLQLIIQLQPTFSDDINLAIEAALEAGAAVLEIYNQNFDKIFKDNQEPLTNADLKSNEILQNKLKKTNYPILSEESNDDKLRLHHSKIWIIDPVDGTSDFINKTGQFSIMIGLVEKNQAVAGVIFQPSENALCVAEKGKGCFLKIGEEWIKLKVTQQDQLNKSRCIGSKHHLLEAEKQFLNQLKIAHFRQHGSAGLKVVEICKGTAEFYFTITNKIKQWDSCAAHCLIMEAGGMVTDMQNNTIKYNTDAVNHEFGFLFSNGVLHEKILEKYGDFLLNFKKSEV